MKQMYDDSDDDTKQAIAKAWQQSKSKDKMTTSSNGMHHHSM